MIRKKIPFIIIIIFTLAGCINYNQEISLYPDGSGTLKIHYWMKFQNLIGNEIINQIGIFSEDSIKNEFSSANTKIENISVYSDSTDSTTHAKIEVSFRHLDSLNKIKALADSKFLLQEGASNQLLISQFIPSFAVGFGFNAAEYHIKYIYDVPGEIITHNAHSVENKKKLIWNYNISEIGKGKTISITYRPFKLKETPYWIYFLSGFILLTVIIFLLRKKRSW